MKKIIGLVLAFCLVFSLVAGAFADSKPTITKQPETSTTSKKGAVSFSISVKGTVSSYTWYFINPATGEKVSGSQLGCNRTKRSAPRNNPQNLRMYRGETVSKGRRSIRKRRYSIQPGDVVLLDNRKYFVIGAQHYGEYIALKNHSAVKITRLKVKRHANGWQ